MLFKYAAPVAALVASAYAESSCTFSATTITAAGDASAIAACTAISGNIAFASGAANPALSLDQVQAIDGTLTVSQDDIIQSFSAPKLTQISGAILFSNLTKLSTIDMSALQKSGDVSMMGCASLQKVTTGTQYQEAGKILIQNTQLSSLGGFGNLSKITALEVSGNQLIADITMNVNTIGTINIGSNQEANMGLTVAFDNLTKAEMISVNNATSVSFKTLQSATGNLAFFYNNFESFALPNLTTAGGLYLNSNNKLSNVSFPELMNLTSGSTSGGSFSIVNNTNLQSLGGFDQLNTVDGAVSFVGAFANISSLNNFKKVNGTFKVSSTQDITDVCNQVKQLKSNQVIRGAWSCTGKSQSAASNVAGSSTGEGSTSSSSGAAGILNIPAFPTLSAGFGAFLLQFLLSF